MLRNMRVMAGLSAAEVAREASLTRHAFRTAEASENVRPDTALRYLLAIERYLQRRCSIASTVRGLVYEASDLIDEADGRRMPPRRFPRLSDMVGFGDGSGGQDEHEPVGRIASSQEAVAVARRAVRRQRFLALWRHRLEERYEPRPPAGYRPACGMRLLEVKRAELVVRGSQGSIAGGGPPREMWEVEIVEDPPRAGFVGYYHAHTWWVTIHPDTGRVVSAHSCK